MLKALGLIFRFIRKQRYKRKITPQKILNCYRGSSPHMRNEMTELHHGSSQLWPEERCRTNSLEISFSLGQHHHLLVIWSGSTPQANWKVYPTLYPKKLHHRAIRGLPRGMCNQPTTVDEAPYNRASQLHGKVISPVEDCGPS